jgi:hypothetical protein
LAHFYVGIAVGVVAFCMEVIEDGAKFVIIDAMGDFISEGLKDGQNNTF